MMFFFGSTDVGMKRSVNQDNFIIKRYSDDVIAAVVCDGMGGAAGGGTASRIALDAFITRIDRTESEHPLFGGLTEDEIGDMMILAVDEANEAVYHAAKQNPSLNGMGTTLVACILMPKVLYTVNVGDSRLYADGGDGMYQVSHDHSYVQYLVDMGRMSKSEAKHAKNRNIITRAVGTERTVETDFYVTEYDNGLKCLLCSDGLVNHVEDDELDGILSSACGKDEVRTACETMIALANERGGLDNITAVILSTLDKDSSAENR